MARAVGKHAWGICDRTGFRYPLADLVYEYQNGKRTGLRVGRDVADPDHPQNFIWRVRTDDAQSLRDPRPDNLEDRGLFGWNPVGNPGTLLVGSVGFAKVEVSE